MRLTQEKKRKIMKEDGEGRKGKGRKGREGGKSEKLI